MPAKKKNSNNNSKNKKTVATSNNRKKKSPSPRKATIKKKPSPKVTSKKIAKKEIKKSTTATKKVETRGRKKKVVDPNDPQLQKAIGEGHEEAKKLHQMVLMNMENPNQLMEFALSPGSLSTYLSSKKSITSRISKRTGKNFPFSTAGLIDFMGDYVVCEDIANDTCMGYISAYKKLYFLQNGMKLPDQDSEALKNALQGRRNVVPDYCRITGAITRERLIQLEEFIQQQNDLSEEEKSLFIDVAYTLYCGALRIFQLRALNSKSVKQDGKKEKMFGRFVWWIFPPRKGEQARLEKKVLDPETTARFLEIFNRRCKKNNNSNSKLFEDFTNSLENKFGEVCRQASISLKWPHGQHFQGTHMFRHGACQDAAREYGFEFGKLRSGHESDKCLKLYAASDAERQIKLNKMGDNNKNKTRLQAAFLDQLGVKFNNIQKFESPTIKGNVNIAPLSSDDLGAAEEAHIKACKKMRKYSEQRAALFQGSFVDQGPPSIPQEYEDLKAHFVRISNNNYEQLSTHFCKMIQQLFSQHIEKSIKILKRVRRSGRIPRRCQRCECRRLPRRRRHVVTKSKRKVECKIPKPPAVQTFVDRRCGFVAQIPIVKGVSKRDRSRMAYRAMLTSEQNLELMRRSAR